MVQISCRPNDVATPSGLFHQSRPWECSSTEFGPTTPKRTSPRTGKEQPTATWSTTSWDHTFEKRSNVRNVSATSCSSGAATHRRSCSSMSGSVWQRRMLRAIEWYQKAFQWRPSPCRFSPTCSHYSHEAISLHGPRKGLWLTVKRLLRCRPFGPSGFDPVPEADHTIVTYHEPMRTP